MVGSKRAQATAADRIDRQIDLCVGFFDEYSFR